MTKLKSEVNYILRTTSGVFDRRSRLQGSDLWPDLDAWQFEQTQQGDASSQNKGNIFQIIRTAGLNQFLKASTWMQTVN